MSVPLPLPTPRGRALARDLSELLGTGGASCEPADLWAHSRDVWARALLWTRAGHTPHPPDAVAFPRSAAEVQAVIRYAVARRTPVTPIGGGSGVCGGSIPVRGGISLSLSRLAGPPRIHASAQAVEVDAGVNARALEEYLFAHGRTLGHDPDGMESATVGGMLATRSTGFRAGSYGSLDELVLSLEAVDGTGALVRTVEGPRFGPDLAQLLLGSEGTLAVITRARLRCVARPTATVARAVLLRSEEEGARALHELVRSGLRPAVLRLHGPLEALLARTGEASAALPAALRLALRRGQHGALRVLLRAPALLNRMMQTLPASVLLLLAFEGQGAHGEADATEECEEALRLCTAMGGEDLGAAPAERWLARRRQPLFERAALFAAGAFADAIDLAATWERLPALLAAVRRALAGSAFVTTQITHAYLEGCAIAVSFAALAGLEEPTTGRARDELEEELAEAQGRHEACERAVLTAAADAGATISHRDGVGLARAPFLQREHGEGMRALRALKRAFDPHGILNPGKLLL